MSENMLGNKIKEYIKNNRVKLYILTPFYGGMCHINYMTCFLETTKLLDHLKIPACYEFFKNDSLITRARNNLVAKAMSDPQMTHIIFIDSDITWKPIDILKLIVSDKDLVGGAYPLKKYSFDKFLQENYVEELLKKKQSSRFDKTSDTDFIKANLLHYNINYIDSNLKIENNLCKIKNLATGFMMIKRCTIEKMIEVFPLLKYTDNLFYLKGNENNFAYALFDTGIEDNEYLSEDWMFCNRWRKLGGEIWLDISIDLTHTGPEDFKGCYMSFIL
jgi:hypothetical protein